MRALLLSLLVCAPAAAQTFRLIDPALTVDNRRLGVVGAPLVQDSFGMLALSVPGAGVFRVATAPFEGASAAGEFEGTGLVFAVDGTSVRLQSASPILGDQGAAPAYVRFDAVPGATTRTRSSGLVRASVTDTPGGTPRSNANVVRATPPRGSAPELRPVPDARAEADALRQTLARVAAERAALEAERDRLRAARALRPAWTGGHGDTEATPQAAVLAAEAERLRAERVQIAAARALAEAERARSAAQLAASLSDAARTRGSAVQTPAMSADLDRLRAEVVARDQTIAVLQRESEDRRIRLAETDAALSQAQRALIAMTAERDAATRQPDARHPDRPTARSGASPAVPASQLADRQRLLDQIAATQAERDALRLQVASLQSDRDRLSLDNVRLTARLGAEQNAPASFSSGAPSPAAQSDAPVASFPGFDFERLANPDAVRRRVDEAEYPRWAREGRITGDVLVLFQTDASGRVVRTAVANPIGGGLDGLAESLVRDMQFVPPVVSGVPAELRSQVLVRFLL